MSNPDTVSALSGPQRFRAALRDWFADLPAVHAVWVFYIGLNLWEHDTEAIALLSLTWVCMSLTFLRGWFAGVKR